VIRLLASVMFLMLISACQETDLSKLPPKERAAVESLAWLKSANAEEDAKEALKRGDKRLLAMATRGLNLPGVNAELSSKAKSVCGIRYLEGTTDMVQGDTHLQALKKAQKYASEYNQLILDNCIELSGP
jgi:hypothetical protein